MKRLAVVGLLLLSLTACGQSVDDVKRDAEFTKVCIEAGGHVWYGFVGEMNCSFQKPRN